MVLGLGQELFVGLLIGLRNAKTGLRDRFGVLDVVAELSHGVSKVGLSLLGGCVLQLWVLGKRLAVGYVWFDSSGSIELVLRT